MTTIEHENRQKDWLVLGAVVFLLVGLSGAVPVGARNNDTADERSHESAHEGAAGGNGHRRSRAAHCPDVADMVIDKTRRAEERRNCSRFARSTRHALDEFKVQADTHDEHQTWRGYGRLVQQWRSRGSIRSSSWQSAGKHGGGRRDVPRTGMQAS